jgi:hypothetical protein
MHTKFHIFVHYLIAVSSAQSVGKLPSLVTRPTIATQSTPSRTASTLRQNPPPSLAPERPSISVSGPGKAGGQQNGVGPFIEDPLIAATFIPASTIVIEPSPTLLPGSSLTCKTVVGDTLWPDFDLWTAALPGVLSVPYIGRDAHPNYFLAAKSVSDVQAAIKFAGDYNIRLSIISSGQDYLGR